MSIFSPLPFWAAGIVLVLGILLRYYGRRQLAGARAHLNKATADQPIVVQVATCGLWLSDGESGARIHVGAWDRAATARHRTAGVDERAARAALRPHQPGVAQVIPLTRLDRESGGDAA